MEEENKIIEENQEVLENIETPVENQINDITLSKKKTNNNKNAILIILLIILLGIAGYFIYTNIIKDNEPDKPKDNNQQVTPTPTPEPTKEASNIDYGKIIEGMTYKTPDGKKTLKIVSKNDEDALKKAQELGIKLNDDNDEAINHRDYFGYYNDVLFLIYENAEEVTNNYKYHVLSGQIKGQVAQCNYTHEFVIDMSNNSLVNFDNMSDGRYYEVHKINDKYYFSEGGCAYGFVSGDVYNEQLKKLGNYFFDNDNNGNIYILDNNYVIKYDNNENIIKKSNKIEGEILRGSVTDDKTLYIIVDINKKLYLQDVINNEKYLISENDGGQYATIDGADGFSFKLENENNLIQIYEESYDNGELKYLPYCTFNPETKELIKK